jgi:hypothetical protein
MRREMKAGHEGSHECGKGEISTLLMSVPGLATIGAFSTDVAMLVALEAPLDAGAMALMEASTDVVFGAIGVILETVFHVVVVALFRAHAGARLAGVIPVSRIGVEVVISGDGTELVFSGSFAEWVGASVKGGDGDGAGVSVKEAEEMARLLLVNSELVEDLILMGAKPSYDVSVLHL